MGLFWCSWSWNCEWFGILEGVIIVCVYFFFWVVKVIIDIEVYIDVLVFWNWRIIEIGCECKINFVINDCSMLYG